MMVENITPLILKNTKNKGLLDNNIYMNYAHPEIFYQVLNANLLKFSKQKNIAIGKESWEAVKNMLPKETQNYVTKAIKLKENPSPEENLSNNQRPTTNDHFAWAAKATGLPETLIIAVGQVESGLRHINPRTGQVIKSPVGALGIMQLMPATAKELGVNVYEQAENILGGAKYLAQAWQKFHGKLELVLAGYNAGINRVKKAIQIAGKESWEAVKNMLPEETQNYVAKAIALMENLGKTETPEDLPIIGSGLESNPLKFPQLKKIFSPQNLLLDKAMVLIINQEQGRGQNNYTQGRWYSEQPYIPQNIKTKEVYLNLLTGGENSIFTALEQVNSGLFQINRPVSLPELPLIIFSIIHNMPFNAEKTIIKLNLTPENLGPLAIKVAKQEDKLTIHFYTTSYNIKEIIEASFPQLKEALFQQNLLLDKAMVLIINQEQGREQNNNYTQEKQHSKQPYPPQNIKTKEVDLNLLTDEENSIPSVTRVNYWI
ncbi:MAG: hypothetical protein STSR0004_07720 [Peptococcaceae bacterium]